MTDKFHFMTDKFHLMIEPTRFVATPLTTGWQSSDGVVVFLKIYYCKSPVNPKESLISSQGRKPRSLKRELSLKAGRKQEKESSPRLARTQ